MIQQSKISPVKMALPVAKDVGLIRKFTVNVMIREYSITYV